MSIITNDMENIAVINALKLSKFSLERIFDSESTIVKSYNFARSLPEVNKIVYLISNISARDVILGELKDKSSSITSFEILEGNSVVTLFEKLKEISIKSSNIFYFYLDCPFLDINLAKKMYDDHIKYFAEYTFADGYPYGLTPEILKVDILDSILKLANSKPTIIGRKSIFDTIKRDINAFDIETIISPKDLRLLRVELTVDTKRNFLAVKGVYEAGGRDAESIVEILDKRGELLRTLPAYIAIQIVEGCTQQCRYCPYGLWLREHYEANPFKISEMGLGEFRTVVDKIESFCDDAIIDISLWGEASLHSNILGIIEEVVKRNALELVVETSGLGWSKEVLNNIREMENEKITWIVSLDAFSDEVYRSIRGEGFKEAVEFVDKLLEYFPLKTYVQAVRMKENEDELERFYRYWREKTENVIIQKYDNFCGILPDRRVTDLSPLKRFPCWHLKRDVSILIDGTVPLCREDFNRRYTLGNIFSDDFEKIWENGKVYYLNHLKGKYPDICKKCDEYYTYNF